MKDLDQSTILFRMNVPATAPAAEKKAALATYEQRFNEKVSIGLTRQQAHDVLHLQYAAAAAPATAPAASKP